MCCSCLGRQIHVKLAKWATKTAGSLFGEVGPRLKMVAFLAWVRYSVVQLSNDPNGDKNQAFFLRSVVCFKKK